MKKGSKKTKGHESKCERAAADKKKLALFLQLAGLVHVRELRLFGHSQPVVGVRLVVKLERVIGVREVLLCMFFDFSVGLNPVEELRALTIVFAHSLLISLQGLVMPRFLV